MADRTGSISAYECGGYHAFEWRIQDFSTLVDSLVVSPDFLFGGGKWYLGIFLNGSSVCGTSGHVDLQLGKYPSGRFIRVSFSLSLKTAKGERHKEEHALKNFVDDDENWFHDINRFVSRAELTRLSSDLLPDDVLTVVCTMKESTSAGSESDSCSAEISTPATDSDGCSSDSSECRHCSGNFAAGILSSHQRKCEQRPVKCPDCLEVVVLHKFLNEHECRHERPEDEACASGSCTNSEEKRVLRDLKELFLNKEDCDVTIKVRGLEYPAHRIILKARSPVFASTFRHDMKENATGIVEIDDCDPSSFSDFLSFLYCGDVGIVSQENVFGLFTAADKYQVLDLRAKCLEFIRNNMAVDTFCETITLALQHSETELISSATDFFVANAEEILLTVKWQRFAAENPTQSNELFIKFVRSVKHSNT